MENVLFITVDSLRADHVGAYGYDRNTTPSLDAIANHGHRFTHAFANAGATRASFPAILTSTSPLMYGGYEYLSERRTLVSEVLSGAGYQTGGFHSNPFLSAQFGYRRGFDTFFDAKSDPSFLSRIRQFVKNQLDEEGILFRTLFTAFKTAEEQAGVEIGSAYVPADDLTDRAVEWLDQRESGRPWFLWIHYMDVHHPYTPPKEYQRLYRSETVSNRESIRLRRKMLENPDGISNDELQQLIDLYDAEIRFADNEAGRLLHHVEQHCSETTIIFTADHGEEFREHGKFSHGTVHDEGVHVPLIIGRNGDEAAGQVHDEIIGLADISPTIAAIAECDIPDSYRGYDISGLIDHRASEQEWKRWFVIGEGGSFPDNAFFYYRDHDWKYIDRGNPSLYNLHSDPNEGTDVSDEHPKQVVEIKQQIDDHKQDIASTAETLESVEVDEDIESRLDALGYK